MPCCLPVTLFITTSTDQSSPLQLARRCPRNPGRAWKWLAWGGAGLILYLKDLDYVT